MDSLVHRCVQCLFHASIMVLWSGPFLSLESLTAHCLSWTNQSARWWGCPKSRPVLWWGPGERPLNLTHPHLSRLPPICAFETMIGAMDGDQSCWVLNTYLARPCAQVRRLASDIMASMSILIKIWTRLINFPLPSEKDGRYPLTVKFVGTPLATSLDK